MMRTLRWWRWRAAAPEATWLLRFVLCCTLSGLVSAPLRAQEPRPLSVEEAVRIGLEQNARLTAAGADAAVAREQYRQVRAAQLPQLTGQASYTRLSDNIPNVEFTFPGTDSAFTFQGVELNRYQAELNLQVPLLSQLRLRHETRAAEYEAEAAERTAAQERADVAFEIRQAYWELYRALATRASLDAALAQVNTHLEEVRAQQALGAALLRDVLAAQTRRSEVLLERVEAENAIRVGQLQLNRLLGLPLDTPLEPTSAPSVGPMPSGEPVATPPGVQPAVPPGAERPPDPAAVETPSASVLAQRPELAALEAQVRGLREQERAANALWLPELDLVARYLYARPNPYFFSEQNRFHGTWELGLAARFTLFDGFRIPAQQGEARARLLAAEAQLEDARERVAVEVMRQQLEVRRAAEAVAVAEQTVREAEETFRVARAQYTEGAALSSEVLDAEEAQRRAEMQLINARADHEIARAALLAALGVV